MQKITHVYCRGIKYDYVTPLDANNIKKLQVKRGENTLIPTK